MASEVQTQSIGSNRVLPLIRETLSSAQGTPRRVPWARFALGLYQRKLAWRYLFILAFFNGVIVETFYATRSEGTAIWLTRAILVIGEVFLVTAPILGGLLLAYRTRSGIVATANVVDRVTAPDRYGQPRMQGSRTVRHPNLGDYHDRFDIASPWARLIERGVELDVLVCPNKRKTLLTLGVHPLSSDGKERRLQSAAS
jgi:hypothetical protein